MSVTRVRKVEGNKADAKQKMEESADKDSENEKPAVTKLQPAEGKTKWRSPRTRTARTRSQRRCSCSQRRSRSR